MEHCHCEEQYESHDLVECIANALDARDPYTGNHSRRVSDMACMLCHYLGLSEKDTQTIHIAAHLHDIGKIGIPDAILRKPARLNDYEWAVMKDHPKIGAEIIGQAAGLQEIARIPAWTDGTNAGLSASTKAAGVDISVVLPVATSTKQVPSINEKAAETNRHTADTGVLSLGCIHPDYEDWHAELGRFRELGLKGFKIHPVYQRTNIH